MVPLFRTGLGAAVKPHARVLQLCADAGLPYAVPTPLQRVPQAASLRRAVTA